MSSEIPFLKYTLTGGNLDELFERARQRKDQEFDEQFSTLARELIGNQAALESQVDAIITPLSNLDVTKVALQQLEDGSNKIKTLSEVQCQLQSDLKKGQNELERVKGTTTMLNNKLAEARKLMNEVPCPYTSDMTKLGNSIVNFMGKK